MPIPTNASPVLGLQRAFSSSEVDDKPRIVASPNAPFFLRAHPRHWEVATEGLDEPTLLPIISKHLVLPGTEGMRTISKNKGESPQDAYRNALRDGEDKGWKYLDRDEVIPAKFLPAGTPEGGYLRGYDCRDRLTNATGVHYTEAWEVPELVPPGERQAFQFDKASYNKWRAHLVESGVVEPPLPGVVRALVQRYNSRAAKEEMLQFPSAEIRERRVKEARDVAEAHASAVVPGQSKATRKITSRSK